MPRYYFDIQEGLTFTQDEDGEDFDDHEAAERGAMRAAAELGRERLLNGDVRDLTVEVKNEDRQRVLSVTIVIKIGRMEPSPKPRLREIRPQNSGVF
jgi:hypothetical protein